MKLFTWNRSIGYEVSTKGDSRFSAFNAVMPDGRSIEQIYQYDIKGYDVGGTDYRLGKGKSPKDLSITKEKLLEEYINLWRI